jgi:hypothetical protein
VDIVDEADALDKVPVRFLRDHLPYRLQEIAWFSEEEAAALIKDGEAEQAKPPYMLPPAARPVRVPIEFVKPVLPYGVGEVAWFTKDTAASFVAQGFAKPAKPPHERPLAKAAPHPEMVCVTFTRPSMPYGGGETVWFPVVEAESYVKQKFAERVTPQPPFVPYKRRGIAT